MAPRNQSVKRQRSKNLKSIKSKTQAALLKRWPKCYDNSSTRPSEVPQSSTPADAVSVPPISDSHQPSTSTGHRPSVFKTRILQTWIRLFKILKLVFNKTANMKLNTN